MILSYVLCNTTWWFCRTCYYIRNHKGSFCCDKKKRKRQDSNKTRLDRLAKGAFVRVGSMAWDVWIHPCSHGLLGCGYGFEGFHGWITMVFLLNNTWWWMILEVELFPQWGFPRVYLVSHFCGYVVYSLACGFQLHIYFRPIMGYVEMVIFFVASFLTSGIRAMVLLL